MKINEHPCIHSLISEMNNEIKCNIEGYVYDYPDRNKPFESNKEDKQEIKLRGDIIIKKITTMEGLGGCL